MKRLYKTNKGYLLSEVLVAISILMMTIFSAVGLVVYGYGAINYNKDSLVAKMLVKECSESLIGLRNTNLLRFSYDKNNCWNVNDNECPSVKTLSQGNYVLEVSFTGTSTFTPAAVDSLDLSNGVSDTDKPYLLNYFDVDSSFDSDNDGDKTNDKDAYTTGASIAESKFYRTMEITNTDGPPATYLNAVCTVAWMEGSAPKKMQVSVGLTN